MKQLYLKNQAEKIKLENVRKYKVDEHNFLVDEQKKLKKAKDTEAHARVTAQLEKVRTDIVGIDEQLRNNAEEFNRLAHRLGKIRLDLYVFADVIYNTLIEYEEFRNKYVVNKDDDNEVVRALTTAIDNVKKLPYEMADGNYTNDLYCMVTEKFMERWKTIKDGVLVEVLKEVDIEYAQ